MFYRLLYNIPSHFIELSMIWTASFNEQSHLHFFRGCIWYLWHTKVSFVCFAVWFYKSQRSYICCVINGHIDNDNLSLAWWLERKPALPSRFNTSTAWYLNFWIFSMEDNPYPTDYLKFHVINSSTIGNNVSFKFRNVWKNYFFLKFLVFSWYSRTRKSRILVQWQRQQTVSRCSNEWLFVKFRSRINNKAIICISYTLLSDGQ